MSRTRNRFPAGGNQSVFWPNYTQHSFLFPDLHTAVLKQNRMKWERLFPRVAVHWFYRHDDHGPAAGLIRFRPGGRVPLHEHQGFEHVLVLQGSQRDENGVLREGGFMVHAPGSRHSILSEEGCLVLAIYEKRPRFLQPAPSA